MSTYSCATRTPSPHPLKSFNLILIFKFQGLYLSTTSLAWIHWNAYVRSIIEKFTITQMPTCQQFKYPVKVQTNSSKAFCNVKLIRNYKLKVSILFPWCSRDIFSTIKPKLRVQCKCNTNIKYTIKNNVFLMSTAQILGNGHSGIFLISQQHLWDQSYPCHHI